MFDEEELEVLFTAPTRFKVQKKPLRNDKTGLIEIDLKEVSSE